MRRIASWQDFHPALLPAACRRPSRILIMMVQTKRATTLMLALQSMFYRCLIVFFLNIFLLSNACLQNVSRLGKAKENLLSK